MSSMPFKQIDPSLEAQLKSSRYQMEQERSKLNSISSMHFKPSQTEFLPPQILATKSTPFFWNSMSSLPFRPLDPSIEAQLKSSRYQMPLESSYAPIMSSMVDPNIEAQIRSSRFQWPSAFNTAPAQSSGVEAESTASYYYKSTPAYPMMSDAWMQSSRANLEAQLFSSKQQMLQMLKSSIQSDPIVSRSYNPSMQMSADMGMSKFFQMMSSIQPSRSMSYNYGFASTNLYQQSYTTMRPMSSYPYYGNGIMKNGTQMPYYGPSKMESSYIRPTSTGYYNMGPSSMYYPAISYTTMPPAISSSYLYYGNQIMKDGTRVTGPTGTYLYYTPSIKYMQPSETMRYFGSNYDHQPVTSMPFYGTGEIQSKSYQPPATINYGSSMYDATNIQPTHTGSYYGSSYYGSQTYSDVGSDRDDDEPTSSWKYDSSAVADSGASLSPSGTMNNYYSGESSSMMYKGK
jgi:hypothetical protein